MAGGAAGAVAGGAAGAGAGAAETSTSMSTAPSDFITAPSDCCHSPLPTGRWHWHCTLSFWQGTLEPVALRPSMEQCYWEEEGQQHRQKEEG